MNCPGCGCGLDLLVWGQRVGTITNQAEHLERVTERIGQAILEFCSAHQEFHADELRAHVTSRCGSVAPASADRVLRSLRRQGRLSYAVVDRRKSLYRVVSQ